MIDTKYTQGKHRRKTVIIAMTGCGKSTLAQDNPDVTDADFGTWRKEQGLDRLWRTALSQDGRSPVAALICKKFVQEVLVPILDTGRIVLTNEPRIWRFLPSDIAVISVVPETNSDFVHTWLANLIYRVLRDHPEQVDEEDSFLRKLMRGGQHWPNDAVWRIPGCVQIRIQSYADLRLIVEMIQ